VRRVGARAAAAKERKGGWVEVVRGGRRRRRWRGELRIGVARRRSGLGLGTDVGAKGGSRRARAERDVRFSLLPFVWFVNSPARSVDGSITGKPEEADAGASQCSMFYTNWLANFLLESVHVSLFPSSIAFAHFCKNTVFRNCAAFCFSINNFVSSQLSDRT
jgi:hypothetical protein